MLRELSSILQRVVGRQYDPMVILDVRTVGRLLSLRDAILRRLPTRRAADIALMSQFEAIGGDNCEFGMVQKHYNADMIGLFRWGRIAAEGLVEALETRFCDLTSAKYLRIGLDEGPPPDRQGRRELLAYHEKYQSAFHTYVFHKDPNDSDARQRVTARLRFLARKLVQDLCMARKIFVYRDPLPAAASNGAALCATLRRYGPNTLLWVSPAQPSHPPGLVEWVGDGLMQGYIDRLRKGHDDPISYELWLRICRNARNLWVGGAPAVLTAVPVPKVHRSCALN